MVFSNLGSFSRNTSSAGYLPNGFTLSVVFDGATSGTLNFVADIYNWGYMYYWNAFDVCFNDANPVPFNFTDEGGTTTGNFDLTLRRATPTYAPFGTTVHDWMAGGTNTSHPPITGQITNAMFTPAVDPAPEPSSFVIFGGTLVLVGVIGCRKRAYPRLR